MRKLTIFNILPELFEMLPPLIWVIILVRIITAMRGKNSGTSARKSVQRGANSTYKPKSPARTELGGAKKLLSSFGNSDFDDYSKGKKQSDGHAKKTSAGYSRSMANNEDKMHRASHMQYSHTYDGHEPWDDCMPKEKDPWDEDFYRQG